MIIGIDASNLLRGGGITHLKEVLLHSHPEKHHFEKIIVWGSESTLKRIENHPWIIKKQHAYLNKSLLFRTYWKSFLFKKALEEERCSVLFVPGGADASGFKPMVTMCRNMLPFEFKEVRRFRYKPIAAKLIALKFVQSRSFKKANGLIFLTKYAQDVVQKTLRLKSKTTTTIISHGISKRFFIEPRKQRREFSSGNPCRVVYVSIIDPYKHHDNVITAIKELHERNAYIHLDLIGPEGYNIKKVIEQMAEVNDESIIVSYHGAVSYEQLHNYYSSADIGLFASSCENMPNILLEMMAAGLPIACSNMGPMPEVLEDAGVYFNPESSSEIASAIDSLMMSTELRENLSAKAFQKAHNFSWQKCADETFTFLKSIENSNSN